MHRPLPRAPDRSAREDKRERGIEAYIDPAHDRIRLCHVCAGKKMRESDVHAVAWGAVDDPCRTAESVRGIIALGRDGAVAGLRGADPALLAFRSGDGDLVARPKQSSHEFMKKYATDTIVVGDEK